MLSVWELNAQTDTVITLNQSRTFFDNGNPKKLITFNSDSCEFFDEHEAEMKSDCCRDGEYKEWYKNGQLKSSGQYDYDLWHDTLATTDPITGNVLYNILSHWKSYKTGLWFQYDSLGQIESISRYINNKLVAINTNANDTVIYATLDSIWVRLADYSKTDEYLFNRSENNKKLVLQFPRHATHNYWRIYDFKIDLMLEDYHPNSLYYWPKGIVELSSDDSCGPYCRNYYDFSQLPAGNYYVYYWSYIGIFYELQVIINDI